MRVRRTGVIAGLAATALLAAACGNGGGSDDPEGGGTGEGGGSDELTIAIQAWMSDKLAIQDMAAAFEEENGVKVSLVEYADNQALSNFALQWSQGQSSQDIVVVDGAETAAQFLAQGLIIDFNETDFFSGDLARENFVGESLAFTELDGVQFAIPLGLEVYNINANRSFFEAADLLDTDGNIPTPETWEDLYDLAAAITEDTGAPGMTIQWGPNAMSTMIGVHQAVRGDLYADDGETLTFDTPEMREVFEIWYRGANEGVFSIDTFTNKDAGRSNYNAGGVAMLLEATSRVPEAVPTIGEENAQVMAMPGSLENGSRAFSAGVIVPSASENQELALQFISEAMMSDLQVQAGEVWGKLPVITAYFDEIEADWRDQIYEFVSKSVPAPAYRDLPVIQERGKEMLQEFLVGDGDVDAFVAELEGFIASSDLTVGVSD